MRGLQRLRNLLGDRREGAAQHVIAPAIAAALLDGGQVGRLLDDARNLAVDLEIGDRVNFLGDRRNVEDFIAAADVFLLVSRSEGHPRSILEAMRAASVGPSTSSRTSAFFSVP